MLPPRCQAQRLGLLQLQAELAQEQAGLMVACVAPKGVSMHPSLTQTLGWKVGGAQHRQVCMRDQDQKPRQPKGCMQRSLARVRTRNQRMALHSLGTQGCLNIIGVKRQGWVGKLGSSCCHYCGYLRRHGGGRTCMIQGAALCSSSMHMQHLLVVATAAKTSTHPQRCRHH